MSKFLNIAAPAGIGIVGILGTAYMLADQFVTDMPAPMRGNIIVPALAEEPAPAAAPMVMADHVDGREGGYGLGRTALDVEVAAWDTDVRPDGQGLPVGSGDVFTGEELFLENCAMCHGDFGEGAGRWPILTGGEGTLDTADPVKSIGSYWPYASTIFDYVHRAMPFGNARSLSDDDVYAITAYLLYLNYIVEDDFVLSNENFTEVTLPNEPNFIDDDRANGEIPAFSVDVCMEDCKETVEITGRARVLDVTPDEEGVEDASAAETDVSEPAADDAAATESAASTDNASDTTTAEAPAAEEPIAEDTAALDPALVAEGEGVFRKCRSCHQIGDGATNRTGPQLNGVVGRPIGSAEGFRYSNTMAEAGGVWDAETLAAFLADPRGTMRGTKMSFAGLHDEDEINAIIAYLSSFSE